MSTTDPSLPTIELSLNLDELAHWLSLSDSEDWIPIVRVRMTNNALRLRLTNIDGSSAGKDITAERGDQINLVIDWIIV